MIQPNIDSFKYLRSLNDEYLIVRFENLVGEEGGGSRKLQLEEIYKIASYIGVKLFRKEALYLADHLFGTDEKQHGQTFRKGQIGSWKKQFSEPHKKRFKELYNAYLIEYGYEVSDDW